MILFFQGVILVEFIAHLVMCMALNEIVFNIPRVFTAVFVGLMSSKCWG